MRVLGDGWTGERIAKLTTLYRSKLPYTQIGRALGVTRNAVSGKIMRLIAEGKLETVHEPVIRRVPKPKAFIFGDGPKHKPEPPKVEEPAPVLEPLRVPLLNITDRQCKFAVSDGPNYEFCGLPVESGKWCCSNHHRIVYVPNAPRKSAS